MKKKKTKKFDEKEYDRQIEKVKKSIKHPHFYYATYDFDSGEVTYKRKKWYQWFSGKRIVAIKIKPFEVKGVASYEKTN